MSSSKFPVSLLYKNEIRFLLSNALKVLTIQVRFNITTSNIYLQDFSGLNYFPNSQGEFLDINQDILIIQPSAVQMKTEEIAINLTDSRSLVTTFTPPETNAWLYTGYSLPNKDMRRSFIRFDNLTCLNGKKIVKAYLRLTGWISSNSGRREVFLHRVEQNYGKIQKWTDMPRFYPNPETSIIIGHSDEESHSWDITFLVRNWVDKIYPNYGVILKQNDLPGEDSIKEYYRLIKPPQIIVLFLTS
ncbi:hypothetical protein SteCoe_3332 [Stentor coeruleus]|uniref:DNRLRE domain-containing protein n=1 Tax=Stentor coeruleus TaxID=5963 RepID=A0A1R2CXB4_9CILI|nr:hypothetical protein SteCoe_3332 [Stentor coeruleus]